MFSHLENCHVNQEIFSHLENCLVNGSLLLVTSCDITDFTFAFLGDKVSIRKLPC